jgi:hypothetical protein
VFSLGEKIGGDESGFAGCGEDDSFGGTGGEVDGAIARDKLLGGSDETVARAEEFVAARDAVGAVSEGGDGLRAADTGDFSTPRRLAAARVRRWAWATTVMRGTPATCAGMTVMRSVETRAKRPPGT